MVTLFVAWWQRCDGGKSTEDKHPTPVKDGLNQHGCTKGDASTMPERRRGDSQAKLTNSTQDKATAAKEGEAQGTCPCLQIGRA